MKKIGLGIAAKPLWVLKKPNFYDIMLVICDAVF
jgi:hypothetical protein